MKYDSSLAQLHDKLTAFLKPILSRAEAALGYCERQKAGQDAVGTWAGREMAASAERELAYLRRVAAAVETHFDDLTEES